MRTVMVSGGFDPLHPGHLAFFAGARKHGFNLVVVVEPDEFVLRKHKVLLPQADRVRMVDAMAGATMVVAGTTVGDCSREIRAFRPDVFCVGEDHADMNFPEHKTCVDLGIEIMVVQGQRQWSSSKLIADVQWGNRPVAVSALVIRNERVLLCKRRQTDLWELPGGFVESGESLEQGLAREVMEEVGARAVNLRYHWSTVGRYGDGRDVLCVYFLADLIDEPKPTQECPDFMWSNSPLNPTVFDFYCRADCDAISEHWRRVNLCG